MNKRMQDQIDAAIKARISICLGLAPLKNVSADFKGGTCTMMSDGTVNYSPKDDKLNKATV